MKFEFNTLSINSDLESFVKNYDIIAVSDKENKPQNKPTDLNLSFLPKYLQPKPDMFKDEYDPEQTVIWFSMLKHWSSYDPAINSKSSPQRVWKFPNELMFKSFLQNFVRKGSKVQIKGDNGIRANLHRESGSYECRWHEKIGNDKKLTSDVYFCKLLSILLKHKRKDLHVNDLKNLYYNIKCGFVNENTLNCETLQEACCHMSISKEEFIPMFIRHLDKHQGMYNIFNEYKPKYEWCLAIKQCSDLHGRDIQIIDKNRHICFKACFLCEHMSNHSVQDINQKSPCRHLRRLPYDALIEKRNEFKGKVKKEIKKRDKKCIVCGSNEYLEVGHVISAWLTTHSLTSKDGVILCRNHNKKMSQLDLLDAFPFLVDYCEEHKINIKGEI